MRSSLLNVIILTLCSLSVTLCSLSVGAQPAADKDRAAKLFEQGKVLMENKDYGRACSKFEKSYWLVKGIGAQYFLARCLTELNQTATAYQHFTEVAEIAARAGQQERADVAKERISELEPRLMKLRIDVTVRLAGLEIDCDGTPIPETSWGQPIPFNPGSHVVTARAPGVAAWERTIELKREGDIRTVAVPDLANLEDGGGAEDEPDGEGPSGLLVSGFAVGGLGIVGLAIGGGLAGAAKSTYNDSDAFCDDSGCDQQGLDLVEDARSLGDGATAIFVVGGVLLAGGATMVILGAMQDDDESAWLPEIRWGVTTTSLRWRF